MISYVKGIINYVDAESVILDHDGIGYLIKVPTSVTTRLGIGEMVTLHTYMYVREDAISLYGFMSREELLTFQILLGVNGIGPKAALAVLSTMSVEELYYAVFSEDAKSIAKTPGIGPKGAKKMIIELKDKLKLENLDSVQAVTESNVEISPSNSSEVQDTIDALVALGYSSSESYRAVHSVSGFDELSSDLLLKAALKHLL